MYIYTDPFTLGPFALRVGEGIDPLILEFCFWYQVCLAQIGPSAWHTVACLRQLCFENGETLTLAHVIKLYSPQIFCGGVLKLRKRDQHALLINVEMTTTMDGWKDSLLLLLRISSWSQNQLFPNRGIFSVCPRISISFPCKKKSFC